MFTAESDSERILKIGQHLPKLWAIKYRVVFLMKHRIYVTFLFNCQAEFNYFWIPWSYYRLAIFALWEKNVCITYRTVVKYCYLEGRAGYQLNTVDIVVACCVQNVVTLRAKHRGAVYCNRSCLWRAGGRTAGAGGRCLLPR